jgi:TetR/AcrR family transcriptional regulator, tetracycline repressor protein
MPHSVDAASSALLVLNCRPMPVRKRKVALPLSRERVCREALALVDEEGLAALSMRRLGARLGVEAMSLYRHVRGKDDLLDALHAAVLGKLQPAEEVRSGDWRGLLGGMAHALRASLLQHPNVVSLFATRPVRVPEALATIGRVVTALQEAGFSLDAARKANIVVGVFTIGHVLGEVHGGPSPEMGVEDGPGIAEFEFGLTALLEGLAVHRRRR